MFFENPTNLSLSDKRALILNILYTLESTDYSFSVEEILRNYAREYEVYVNSDDKIVSIIENIVSQKNEIDEEMKPYLKNWNLDRISLMVKLILRYAIWEFKNEKNDAALIINEAVELAKGFAEEDSFRFVNGVLENWYKKNKN